MDQAIPLLNESQSHSALYKRWFNSWTKLAIAIIVSFILVGAILIVSQTSQLNFLISGVVMIGMIGIEFYNI